MKKKAAGAFFNSSQTNLHDQRHLSTPSDSSVAQPERDNRRRSESRRSESRRSESPCEGAVSTFFPDDEVNDGTLTRYATDPASMTLKASLPDTSTTTTTPNTNPESLPIIMEVSPKKGGRLNWKKDKRKKEDSERANPNDLLVTNFGMV